MKRSIIVLASVLALGACAPVNRATRLAKLPREYAENYGIEGVKAPKSELDKTPWIVYSDRVGNAAYHRPGGRVKAGEMGFRDAYLVIKRKGEYLRLIKYKAENVKGNHLAARKKAEYVGWVDRSRLLLSPTSRTDIRTGLKEKVIVALADTAAVFHPGAYLSGADSAKVFTTPDLKEVAGTVPLHSIVYTLKASEDGYSALVATAPDITTDNVNPH